jgi:hypothetical protein
MRGQYTQRTAQCRFISRRPHTERVRGTDFVISGTPLSVNFMTLNGISRRCAGAGIAASAAAPEGAPYKSMRTKAALTLAVLTSAVTLASSVGPSPTGGQRVDIPTEVRSAADIVAFRRQDDLAAMQTFRPGYSFWQHVFVLPDHSIAYGSATTGRLLVTFPTKGNWTRDADWGDPALSRILQGQTLARKLGERRDQVASLLEREVGPVHHNSTRGDALIPNAKKYGRFLGEWGAIYERFGVPADIGLAQVILESGLSATRRSEANAIGFCQWLRRNWRRLNDLSPTPIEGNNQTTQAPYCAAYLSVLAAKYGSFIPALSEHNAGGTNVGRALITGAQLGGGDVRSRYFLGSKLAVDLRDLPGNFYGEVHQTYGPRSYLYAEMVFGNTFNVQNLLSSTVQVPIHAMRTPRPISLVEIISRTNLSAEDVRLFNPALTARIPTEGTLYLPHYVSDFGRDVAFWRRPADPSYTAVLDAFLSLESGPERWDDPSFAPVLTEFRRRFGETNTEEGMVMATVLAYAMDQAYASSRRTLLAEFKNSEEVRMLIARGMLELDVARAVRSTSNPQ